MSCIKGGSCDRIIPGACTTCGRVVSKIRKPTLKQIKREYEKAERLYKKRLEDFRKSCNHKWERQFSCAENWSVCKKCGIEK